MVGIETSSLFRRQFKKLPIEIKHKALRREKVFVNDPFDTRLGTHKLGGKRNGEWAYWVDYSYRITFFFLGQNRVLYTAVGTHDQVY